ncbi:MAG TPA: hypothetical protein EYP10_01025 [Armatimonadetes bacterium]|nr:hypothetical protein [Armatimonadota bacterium]
MDYTKRQCLCSNSTSALRIAIAIGISLLGAVGLSHAQLGAPAQRVVIITLDGLAAWVLPNADCPNIRMLMRDGCWTMNARTVRPSETLPAHTSLLTALPPSEHHVDWNHYLPQRGYLRRKTLFTFAKWAGLKTAMIIGKKKLFHLANPQWVDYAPIIKRANARKIADAAVKCIEEFQPHVLLVHFPDPDWMGHKYGWGSKQQLRAIEECDTGVGKIVTAIKRKGWWRVTLLIVTADHGGHNRIHHTRHPYDITIPWICSGGAVKARGELKGNISICDTAPTAAYALALYMPDRWKRRAISKIFEEGGLDK